MHRHLTFPLVFCLTGLTLFGCAPTVTEIPVTIKPSEAILPEIDLIQLKESADEALKVANDVKINLQIINSKLAELDNTVMTLSDEVAVVSSAKLEELENRLALLLEAYKNTQSQISALKGLPELVKSQMAILQSQAGAAGKGGAAGSAPKVIVPPTFSPSAAQQNLISAEYAQYQNGLHAFDKRNYPRALEIFLEVTAGYPHSDYQIPSRYWAGECYYRLGDYAQAIATFIELLKHPENTKSDDAQFKMALSYLKMGQNGSALQEFKTLVATYPSSEYLGRARKYIASLK